MITIEEYKSIIAELLDELPEEFFRELSGGVVVSEAPVVPDYARGDDIYTMGQYQVSYGMRQIMMYKGSFDRAHLESIGGIRNSSSLEVEDEREKQAYLAFHGE